MSHELRTPLNSIIGFAELMHKGKVGPMAPDHVEFLGDILTSAHRLLQLDQRRARSREARVRQDRIPPEPDRSAAARSARSGHLEGADQRQTPHGRGRDRSERRAGNRRWNADEAGVVHAALERGEVHPAGGGSRSAHERRRASGRSSSRTTASASHADDLVKLFVEFPRIGRASPATAPASASHSRSGSSRAMAAGSKRASTVGVGSTFVATLPRVQLWRVKRSSSSTTIDSTSSSRARCSRTPATKCTAR